MKPIISPSDFQKLKKASYAQALGLMIRIYRQGYEEGLRDAEKEYDDPNLYKIVDADAVIEQIGEEQYKKLFE